MLPFRIIDRAKFLVERQLVKGAGFQLLVVGLFIGVISLLGGILVIPQGGEFEHVGSAIWWAFLRLTDPGYLGDDVGTWQRIVSTLLTLSGYVVFMGTLVAIPDPLVDCQDGGPGAGADAGHPEEPHRGAGLDQSDPAAAVGAAGLDRPDAPLPGTARGAAAQPGGTVGGLLRRTGPPVALGTGHRRRARQVILRSGTAIQPEALHRVACLEAAAVIVPSAAHHQGSLVTSDVETVKALLSIAAQARQRQAPLPYVVAEIQDVRKLPVIERPTQGRWRWSPVTPPSAA